MRKDKHERYAYALRRLSAAVDRSICATTAAEKERPLAWVIAWAKVAKIVTTKAE